MQTDRLKELILQAVEISASVPESLREAAFHRALDVLLKNTDLSSSEQRASAPGAPLHEAVPAPIAEPVRPRHVRFVTPLPLMRSTFTSPPPIPTARESSRPDFHRPSGALRKRRARERICDLLRQLSEDGYFDKPRSTAELSAHMEQLIGPLCTPALLAKALRQLEREGTLACDHNP